MDKDIKKGMSDIEKAVEAIDEETVNAERLGSVLGAEERIEDKRAILRKLRKLQRNWRISSIIAVIAIIILLLYMVIVKVFFSAEQTVTGVQKILILDHPVISQEEVASTTLGELDAGLSGDAYIEYDGKVYDSSVVDAGTRVWSLEDYWKKFRAANLVYKESELQLGGAAQAGAIPVGCIVHNGETGGNYKGIYYNAETLGYVGAASMGKYFTHDVLTINVTAYDDVDVEGIVLEALGKGTYEDVSGAFNNLANAFEGQKCSVESERFSYNYYDEVNVKDGKYVCVKDGKKITPEKVTKYSFEIHNYDYNIFAVLAETVR